MTCASPDKESSVAQCLDGERLKGRLLSSARILEHDPEKWKPVFRKDHAQTKR